mmetsp:Transcript_14480/g.45332  ORF Transcript_14480/g.45332 Transcript_14480/m.45332 type:complete len:386 (-) Transcript_14480:147-1304(-)
MGAPAKEQFASFGFIQFFAAVHIFTHHLWQQTKYLNSRAYRGWGPGWVACFFVLSGFKLTYSQLRRKDPSKIDPFVPYMWRRLARLYPLYYVSLLITAVECYKEGHPRWIVLPFNLTLTFTWIGSVAGGWHAGWHGAHWYMGDLLFHQICWRWAYPVVRRLSDRSCLCLLVVCILITFLRCFLTQWGIAEQETTFWAPYTFNQFLSGMCLAKLHVSRPSPPQGVPADRVALIIGERRVPLSGLGSFALILAVFRLVHPDLAEFYLKRGGWLGSLHPLFVLLVWCICLEEGPLDWLCHRRPFAWMGELSYGVYLFHWNAIRLTVKFGARFLPMRRSEELRFWGIIFPATVLFSALMMFLFDRPVQRWASAFLRGPVTPATVHTKTA